MQNIRFSIIILTYNRPDELLKTTSSLLNSVTRNDVEIIVVDNGSEKPADSFLDTSIFTIIRLQTNIGVAARNAGIKASKGDIVITLDDDVKGIDNEDINYLHMQFERNKDIAAINFKVLEEGTNKQINWCHHRKIEDWGNSSFETYEISEGAVAFRKEDVLNAGLYPDNFFISHEGPDLAIRIMDLDKQVIYDPNVYVYHSQCQIARANWRRYYYDTRNTLWYLIRHFPLSMVLPQLMLAWASMFVYSVRDGYTKYWVKGVIDSFKEMGSILEQRKPISIYTARRLHYIKSSNPSLFYMVKKRLFSKSVSI